MSANQIGLNTISTHDPKALFAGDLQRVTAGVTLVAGKIYPEGSALGKITDSGKCTLADAAASDGSEELYGILGEAVDATTGDRTAVAYLTGEFARQRIICAEGSTVDNFIEDAREKGLFFKDVALQPNE